MIEQNKFETYISTVTRGVNDGIHHYNGDSLSRYIYHNQCLKLVSINKKFEVSDSIARSYYGLDDPLFNCKTLDKDLVDIPVPGSSCFFEAAINIIFGQLVCISVANKMIKQFVDVFGKIKEGYKIYPLPNEVLSNSHKLEQIKTTKLKKQAIIEVARLFSSIKQNHDGNQICNSLLSIKGIGQWSISWFKLKALRLFNEVPYTDLAVRRATSNFINKPKILSAAETLSFYTENLSNNRGCYMHRILCQYK